MLAVEVHRRDEHGIDAGLRPVCLSGRPIQSAGKPDAVPRQELLVLSISEDRSTLFFQPPDQHFAEIIDRHGLPALVPHRQHGNAQRCGLRGGGRIGDARAQDDTKQPGTLDATRFI